MRLINVDAVKSSLLTELLMGIDGGTDASYLKTYEVIDRIEKIVNEWVDNQITVEAIPVERIVKRINYYSNLILTHPNEKELLYSQTELISLLEEWEKENEK